MDTTPQDVSGRQQLHGRNSYGTATAATGPDMGKNFHIKEDIIIPPRTTLSISVAINKQVPRNKEIWLISTPVKSGVTIPEKTVEVIGNKTRLTFVNSNEYSVNIKDGTKIGEVQNNETKQVQCVQPCENAIKEAYPNLTWEDIKCDNLGVKNKVVDLINKYRQASWLPGEPQGHYTDDELEIEVKDKTIVNRNQYTIPVAYKEALQAEITKMLKDGTITHSKSSYNSPLIIVKKADGGIRPCIDFRLINKIIEPISYPMPKIPELLQSLGQAKYLTSLDLANAFHQCSIKENSRKYTAFTVNNCKYEYCRVPFGLQSSPGFFARIINSVLRDLLDKGCLAYMDDIVLFSRTETEHLQLIEKVLQKLSEAGIKLKITKCLFFATHINFLGYRISPEGITMKDDRIDTIKAMPTPTSKKQVQSFLGMCNYYRLFIHNFAHIADPIYKLLRKNQRFAWGTEQQEAAQILKDKLASAPVVKYPDFEKPFFIHTDASNVGIGAVLMQKHQSKLHPIMYISKTLNEAQRRYPATKKEALALVFALESFRHLILLFPVTVYTDHLPLLGALKKPTKDQCLQRWSLLIQEYDVKFEYLKGDQNILADVLSRLPRKSEDPTNLDESLDETLNQRLCCNALNEYIPVKSPWTERELRNAQQKDPFCLEIIKNLRSNVKTIPTKLLLDCKLVNGTIYVVRRIKRATLSDELIIPYIPDALIPTAFKLVHGELTTGHNGYERTLKLFVKNFININERKLVKTLCETCEPCLRAKQIPKPVPIGKYPVPKRPFDTIASDVLGPLRITEKGNRYILTIRDVVTRYTLLYPMQHKDTDTIIDALKSVIANYGSSLTLITDNAAEYKAEKLVKFLEFYNTRKVFITPWHPASQGLSERINREILKILRVYINEVATNDWDAYLHVVQVVLNNTYNSSIRETPFYALYGYDSATANFNAPKLSYGEDELQQHLTKVSIVRQHCRDNLLRSQAAYTEYTNKDRTDKNIHVGQRVFAKLTGHKQEVRTKLHLPVDGPFEVIGKKGRAWHLKELATAKKYLVHPDFIIIGPRAPVRRIPAIEHREDLTDDSTEDSEDNEVAGTSPQKTTTNATGSANDRSKTRTTRPNVPTRKQPPRACKK